MTLVVKAREPDAGCFQHFGLWAAVQIATHSSSRSPFIFSQLIQQLRNAFSELRDRFEQRLVAVYQSIYASMNMVAIRIALAVLHVANQWIGPVAEPQRPVRAGSDLRGTAPGAGDDELGDRRLDRR